MEKKKTKKETTKNTKGNVLYRDISEFLEHEYKDVYVHYVLENRALPSLVDGFKTGARKILHAAFNGSLKNGNLCKLLVLSGDTFRLSLYMHGDASLNGTIATMAQGFNFNLNPIESDGQVGSLRDPEAISAPRYLSVKLSKYASIWKTDYDMLEYVFDEGAWLEPKYYLPIIPTVLCNHQIGMAPGYRFDTKAYNPIDIIDACLECLTSRKKSKKLDDFTIRPYYRGYNNKNFIQSELNVWRSEGKYKFDSKKYILTITDLPYDVSYDDFEKLLNKYIESETIKDWKDKSEDGSVYYEIFFDKTKFSKDFGTKNIDNKIVNKFKLIKNIPYDNIWVLDENSKIKHFKTPQELIEYFVEFRLLKYDDRKKKLVSVLNDKISNNNDLIRFIELVCKGKLKIRNRSKKDVEVDMKKEKLPTHLLSTPMSKVTIEERDELIKENQELVKKLEYIKKTTTKQMYKDDLNNLRKEIEKDFK